MNTHSSTKFVASAHSNAGQESYAIDFDRPILIVYLCYRLGITALLSALFFSNTGIGDNHPQLFISSMLAYFSINVFSLAMLLRNWQPGLNALLFIVLSDIALIQLIAQASGPLESGLGTLMVISVAAGSIFIRGKLALIVPSFATLSLLGGVGWRILHSGASKAEIVTSGWFGFSFFITSLALNQLATRMQASETRAREESRNAKKMEQLNQLVIARMQTGVMVVDIDGKIISSNKAAAKLLGNNDRHTLNKLADISAEAANFHHQVQQHFDSRNIATDTSRAKFSMQHSSEGNNYKLTWVNLDDGKAAGALIFVEDLSRIAQQVQQLKLSSLGKLTASIAHEIRNPLGAVSHAAQLLQDENDHDEDQKLTRIIVEQTKRASNIIDAVMDVSRGKAAQDSLFDLVEWLPNFLQTYSIGKNTDIQLELPESAMIRFDATHLAQIISNLLDNALRHSRDACGDECALLVVSHDNDNCPRIDIKDTGHGVAAEQVERLFEPFFTTGKLGSGLGLYMCRELCAANQSTISYVDACPT
ncbi:MAG: hypothetical protein KJO24_06890, partial [Gammaproteobacteria bacterium]|nr:hypothetical protein [Gammaproteobacteria bacterium]